jgi:hypothetical protein
MLLTSLVAFLSAPAAFAPEETKPSLLPRARHKQYLLDAADLIERNYHGKDNLCWCADGEVSYCIQGAIFKVATGTHSWPHCNPEVSADVKDDIVLALQAAESASGVGKDTSRSESRYIGSSTLATWNNRETTTKEQVVAVLRRAAAA